MLTSRCIGATLFGGFLLALSLFAETESNNTAGTANVLPVNGSQSGTLSDSVAPGPVADNFDWYSVVVPADGRLTLISVASGTNVSVSIYLYRKVDSMNLSNPGGDWIGGVSNGITDTIRDNLHAGTYYVQVERYSGRPSYTLTSSFSAAALTNDSEVDDTPKVAITIAPNTTATGHLGYYSTVLGTDTYDWYKVTTPGEGKFTIITKTSDGSLDLQPYLYRAVSDMNNVNSPGDWVGPAGDAVNDTVSDFLRAGTYYIEIIRRSGAGSYTLQEAFTPAVLAADAEPNDIPNQAIAIPLDSLRSGHLGYYSNALGSDSYDWYKVTVPAARTLRFMSQTTGGDLDLQLYIYTSVSDMTVSNPSGTWYGSGSNQLRDTVSTTVNAGTYYLQIIRRSGIGSYSLACGTAIPSGVRQLQTATSAFAPSLKAGVDRSSGGVAVQYTLPERASARIDLYDMTGALVASARCGVEAAGPHRLVLGEHALASGLYCCRLRAGKTVLSQMVQVTR